MNTTSSGKYFSGQIFLGDGGAYLLGHLLVWCSIMLINYDPKISPFSILLIFFWIASMMLVLKIIEEPKTIFLFFLGLFLGFAFLSKYAAIYFLISLLLFFIFEKKKYYRVLTNPLGILIFV